MPKSTLGLALISKDWDDARRVVETYSQYFDEVYVQLNGTSKKPLTVPENVHVSTFRVARFPDGDIKDFATPRNKLLKEIKTDYWMWLDADDEIVNPEKLRELVARMDEEKLDAVYLQYIYGYNEQKEPIAIQWREQILRTAHPFKWIARVHETLISSDKPTMAQDDRVVRKHLYKSHDEMMKSAIRNHKIMEDMVKEGDEDPRTLYYLGRSYFMLERYKESAQTLLIYTEQSGWDEQKYDAWMKIGDALVLMDEHEKALNANLEAIKLNPTVPDGYLKIGDLYLALEQPGRAIEWLKTGMGKRPPRTLEIVDPTLYTYRPLVSLALAYFGLADVNTAKKYIDEAAGFQPRSQLFKNTYNAINTAYIEEQTIKNAAWLGKFVEERGDIKSFIDGLPGFIKNDLRLRPLRVKAYPPKKWPEKSIVFFCGEQWEEWGPETLKNGMGGSEEAITYLSEELAKLGWQVTVYNQRTEELKTEAGVDWKPWETFNPEDEFDVFVAWRNPWMVKRLNIKARIKAVDMHDTPIGHQAITQKALDSLDLIFLKSEYQRKLGKIPKDKAVVIPNGIVPEQFLIKDIQREPHKVIYASSADRGLDVLVREVWPKVLEAVPDAELVWAYGWNSYDALHKGDAAQAKWKWELKRDMFNLGVKELGRLSHEDLAKEFTSASVWAYPTYFDEICCITAKKAQAAGCDVITTGRAALQTAVLKDEEDSQDIKKFTMRLIDALNNPISEKQRDETAKKVLNKFGWKNIAKEWDRSLDEDNTNS